MMRSTSTRDRTSTRFFVTMHDLSPIQSPKELVTFEAKEGEEPGSEEEVRQAQRACGELLWVAQRSRPDIDGEERWEDLLEGRQSSGYKFYTTIVLGVVAYTTFTCASFLHCRTG